MNALKTIFFFHFEKKKEMHIYADDSTTRVLSIIDNIQNKDRKVLNFVTYHQYALTITNNVQWTFHRNTLV